VIRFLLEEIEKSPNPLFCKKELISLSEDEFRILIGKKILIYVNPQDHNIQKLRCPRCQHGCGLTVLKSGEGYEAVCLEHPEEDPIPVSVDDLSRYRLSVDKLLFELRSANRIEGDLNRIRGGYYYVGYKSYNDNRVGFVFIQDIGQTDIVNLSGLKHFCKDDDILVVLTSVSGISDVILRRHLANEQIVQISLAASINSHTFELPIREHVSRLLKPKDAYLAELSAKQKRDYENFEYLCYDKIHIRGMTPKKRSNLIVINGTVTSLGDSLFRLFLRLVLELKKKNGGWIDRYTMESEGIVPDAESFQPYSNLRDKIRGGLIEMDGLRFIESDGSKNYRLSIHPDFITYDKKKLRNHPDNSVREISKKLP
jgi:hypothetical protein